MARRCVRMVAVRREGRALLESTPSARRDAEAWAGVSAWRLPPLCPVPCLGFKAKNSGGLGAEPPGNPRGENPCTRAAPQPAVGHMSTYLPLRTLPACAGKLGRQVPSRTDSGWLGNQVVAVGATRNVAFACLHVRRVTAPVVPIACPARRSCAALAAGCVRGRMEQWSVNLEFAGRQEPRRP